jgi:hypothetical protein
LNAEPSKLLVFDSNNKNHLRRVVKTASPTTNQFEPAKTSGDDFDL